MASWTTLLNAIFLVGKPITSASGLALRDNPISIAEGAPGAPRIHIGALQRLVAGNQVRSRLDTIRSASSGSNTVVVSTSFSFLQSGSIRLTFEHSSTGGSTEVVRLRGGALTVLSSFGNPGTLTARTLDVPVLPGDTVSVNTPGPLSGGTGSASQRNVRWMTNGQDLYPGSEASLEGNTYV